MSTTFASRSGKSLGDENVNSASLENRPSQLSLVDSVASEGGNMCKQT